MTSDLAALAHTISSKCFEDETTSVKRLVEGLSHLREYEQAILSESTRMVEKVRAEGLGISAEAFLHQYGLDTHEGVAIMCLAEALLRIPDATTADRLIRGTFEGTDWMQHIGKSDNVFVNASGWGLMLTGKVVNLGSEKPTTLIEKLVGKLGEPTIRSALKQGMKFIGSQFVLGETIEDALANARSLGAKGYRFSYDILGEGARTDEQAMGYVNAYYHAIDRIAPHAKGLSLFAAPSISVKLSALHPRYSLAQKERVIHELAPRLIEILRRAKAAGITVALDAEESARLDIEMELFSHILEEPTLADWNGIGFVIQGYQKRCYHLIDFLISLARKHNRVIPLRLVKGAYWDSEIKWAQWLGLPDYPVFTRKEHTDVSYLACADKILKNLRSFYPQFATHNARTIASIHALASRYGAKKDEYEFQRLHGMGEKLHDQVLSVTPSRIYAPVGEHKDLLAYLIRRLLENGANTSFVNLLMDKDTSIAELLADPVRKAVEGGMKPNDYTPLPHHLYGNTRSNSAGMDFGNAAMVAAFESKLAPWDVRFSELTAASNTTREGLDLAIQTAHSAWADWAKTSVETRAQALEKTADLFEKNGAELIALCVYEAGKTLPDAVAEIREAADFCRYYAWQARALMGAPDTLKGPTGESNLLSLHPRGVIGCISPWNFPLAIFTGQVVAALVTGNCVVAKPAEQTPLIAKRAIELMIEAGIPKDVLQLVIGEGETIGAGLVSDMRIRGVVFTGSVEVAHIINHTLAMRGGAIVPLIAETGGMNCMVVDSSALLEQAVDDIVLSAFGSAGQRCSALRVLFVQEDIAEPLMALLRGAMAELRVGNPRLLSTDIGPVIDADAQKNLLEHIARMKISGKLIAEAPAPKGVHKGHFVAPCAFGIPSIDMLEKEVFGPVLHIVRFKASEQDQVVRAINSTGYGLTFGIHSRIEDNIEFFCSRIHAGNLYVNRSMIGATVGVQPFGGEGLSGTGPKAGGPYYLLRFLSERVITTNTTAIGGNLDLLSSSKA